MILGALIFKILDIISSYPCEFLILNDCIILFTSFVEVGLKCNMVLRFKNFELRLYIGS